MKVILPSNSTHTIKFTPRYEPTNILSLEVTKEGVNTTEIIEPTYTISNGVMSLTFDLDVLEQDRYSFKLIEDEEVVFRGKLFATEQEPQDFKLTKNTYTYV